MFPVVGKGGQRDPLIGRPRRLLAVVDSLPCFLSTSVARLPQSDLISGETQEIAGIEIQSLVTRSVNSVPVISDE